MLELKTSINLIYVVRLIKIENLDIEYQEMNVFEEPNIKSERT